MPQYLSPGVYVEEVEAGSRPIEGVGTAVAASETAGDLPPLSLAGAPPDFVDPSPAPWLR